MDEEEKKVEEVITDSTTKSMPPEERKGFNITSMVLGIIATLFFCVWYVSLPCGIIAIIFSVAGKNYGGRGMGVAGMIMGIIGLIIAVLWLFVLGSMILALNEAGYAY